MQCWYMNGAGNDFMVIDARGKKLDFSPMAVELCKQTGADGFMAIDDSEVADFKLHFYNSDGSRGEMCGNGARCICRFACELGVAGEEMTVETDAGLVYGKRISESHFQVKLNDPSVVDLHRKGDVAYVELGDPGVPHGVLEVEGLSWERKEELLPMALYLTPYSQYISKSCQLYLKIDPESDYSHHLHCLQPGPSHQHLSPGLLQQPPRWSPCFCR